MNTKVLEKLQKKFSRIELHDWGSFYFRKDPVLKKENQDRWVEYQGFWVSPLGDAIIPAILERFLLLDGKNIEDFFLFQVLTKDGQILASNI